MDAALVRELIASALVVIGVSVITISVYGMFRMPDLYSRLHAASMSVILGVVNLLAASVLIGDWNLLTRALLVAVFLLLTAPLSAHAIGRAQLLDVERAGRGSEGGQDEAGAD